MEEPKGGLRLVLAHPDDESMGAAGLILRHTRNAIPTYLICATYGEAGWQGKPRGAKKEDLPEIRAKELEEAAAALALSGVELWDYPDGGVASADHPEITHRIGEHIARLQPRAVVGWGPDGGYGHPDHLAAYRHVTAAFDTASDPLQFPDEGPPWQPSRLFYTAMLRSFFQKMREPLQAAGVDTSDFERPEMQRLGYEDADVTTTIDVSDYTDAKQAGFSAHRTQFAADGPFSRLDAETQRTMFAYEHYILARPVDAGPVAADDLFG